jgi:hypothetical protein
LSKGIKQIDLVSDSLIAGIRQHEFDLERGIKAYKSFKTFGTGALLEIKLDKKYPIKGKRDITNILTALDMLN